MENRELKNALYICLLIASSFFASCTGPDGAVMQKYWWTGSLNYFYDSNPYAPSTIINDRYFETATGTHYLEYTAWNGISWYTYYSITANPGTVDLEPGDPLWYEIDLLSSGPSLYRSAYPRAVTDGTAAVDEPVSSTPSSETVTRDLSFTQGPILGEQSRTYDFGTITIQYGRLTK